MIGEYQHAEKALAYLAAADQIPERTHGERMVLDLLHRPLHRVMDIGTGDGRLMSLVKVAHPSIEGVAIDFSPTMIDKAHERFRNAPSIQVINHDIHDSILSFGKFDAVVSSFAIHHVENQRKLGLYREIYSILEPGGTFVNFEHVSSPTEALHDDFLKAMGITRETEDQSNRCSPIELQLFWLREIGFENVDCFWKWRELAVLSGTKPNAPTL